jgi:hypothetical protein
MRKRTFFQGYGARRAAPSRGAGTRKVAVVERQVMVRARASPAA